MYFHRTPKIFEILFPSILWRVKTKDKSIFLTFDDGPIPELTPYILKTLSEYKAKATFFVVGDNVLKHPELNSDMIAQGHKVANHTFNHLNGWEVNLDRYVSNVDKCEASLTVPNNYFRPPYGKMTWSQARTIGKTHQIVMWDSLTGDFDAKLSPQECLDASIRATRQGSIVVFHDNLKVKHKLHFVLPAFLDHFTELGYNFLTLP